MRLKIKCRHPIILFALLLAGCAAAASPADGRAAHIIGQAEQTAPPALVQQNNQLIAAWIGGASGREAFHLRAVGSSGEPVTLNLAQRQARSLQLIVGSEGTVHLFWLDFDADQMTTLYSALVSSAEMAVLRGPFALSDAPAFRYSAAADDGGGALVAWSGGAASEPTVRVRHIDRLGRPRDVIGTISAAVYPTLLRLDDRLHLYWIDSRTGGVYESRIDQLSTAPSHLTSSPHLAAGDRLIDMRVGAESAYLHIFWNLVRADGTCAVWHSWRALNGTAAHPQPLMLPKDDDDAAALCYAAPLNAQQERLPVAAAASGDLVLLTFARGALAATSTLLRGIPILAPPLLMADESEARWWLAWSQPNLAGYADLTLLEIPQTADSTLSR